LTGSTAFASELQRSRIVSRLGKKVEPANLSATVAEIQRKHIQQYIAAALCAEKTEASA